MSWTNGAIGNNVYKGVLLRHILLDVMGLEEALLVGKGLHVVFVGGDNDDSGKNYEVSIPVENALDPKNEITLAYEMNDQALTAAHGYPLRVICPGYVGVRSCKWVTKIIISNE